MKRLLRPVAVLGAAAVCAAVLGVGVPLGWVWVASQLQPSVGQSTANLAALTVVVGPVVTYIALFTIAGRISGSAAGTRPQQRMAWNRSRDEARQGSRSTSTLEQVVVLATVMMGVGFEVWFFLFAHQQPWGG